MKFGDDPYEDLKYFDRNNEVSKKRFESKLSCNIKFWHMPNRCYKGLSQLTFTCSKSKIETLEKGVK